MGEITSPDPRDPCFEWNPLPKQMPLDHVLLSVEFALLEADPAASGKYADTLRKQQMEISQARVRFPQHPVLRGLVNNRFTVEILAIFSVSARAYLSTTHVDSSYGAFTAWARSQNGGVETGGLDGNSRRLAGRAIDRLTALLAAGDLCY